MKKFKLFTLVLSSILFMMACNSEMDNSESDLNTAVEDLSISSVFVDVFDLIDEASDAAETNDKSIMSNPCASLTIVPMDTTWPKTITIDYGSVNCLCNDGKYRRGVIVINQSDFKMHPGATRVVNFNNFYVNDNHVEGEKTIVNEGFNTSGNLCFSIELENGIITRPDSTQIFWDSYREREWIDGMSTPNNKWDNEFLITGYSTLINAQSDTIESEITTALNRLVGCHWFRSGVVEQNISNGNTRIIDYGNGSCDASAEVTINGTTFTITLN